MKKILVISDAHKNVSKFKEIKDREEYDYMFYAGDWALTDTTLLEDSNVYAVAGNHDLETEVLRRETYTEIDGVRIYMTHGHWYTSLMHYVDYNKMLHHTDENEMYADLYIHGHDHECKQNGHFGRIFINPGSISEPRGQFNYGTYMMVTVNNGEIENIEIKRA